MHTQNNTFANDILSNVFSNVNNIENADSVATLLDKFGLNWTVSKQPLMLPNGSQTPFLGIVRNDNNTTFATCKDGYKA